MPGGNSAVEEARVRMVTVKVGSARRARRMGAPTEPVAPAMRMFWRGDMVEEWGEGSFGIGFRGSRA